MTYQDMFDDDILPLQEEASAERGPVDPVLASLRARFGLGPSGFAITTPLAELLHELRTSTQASVRAAAARCLGLQADKEHGLPALLTALADPDSSVRSAVAHALMSFGNAVNEEPVLAALAREHDEDVRSTLINLLSTFGSDLSDRAITSLLTLFNDTTADEVTRSAIVYALGELDERTPFSLLTRALSDPHWLVREAAVLMIGCQPSGRVLDVLEPLLYRSLREESEIVRCAIYHVLGQHVEQLQEALIPPDTHVSDCTNNLEYPVLCFESAIEVAVPTAQSCLSVVAMACDPNFLPVFSCDDISVSTQVYRDARVCSEYVRALIHGERLFVPVHLLESRSTLVKHCLEQESEYCTFMQLLDEGTISPIITPERRVEDASLTRWPQASLLQWDRLLARIREHSQPLSSIASQKLRSWWHLPSLNDGQWLKDGVGVAQWLGLQEQDISSFEQYLPHALAWLQDYTPTDSTFLSSSALASQYVMQTGLTWPLSEAFKQLFHLAYYHRLASVLHCGLCTPADAPPGPLFHKEQTGASSFITCTSATFFALLEEPLFFHIRGVLPYRPFLSLRSLHLCNLENILALRKTEEWDRYIQSLKTLSSLDPQSTFHQALEVYRHYLGCIRTMTAHVRHYFNGSLDQLVTGWEPTLRIAIDIGAYHLSLIWRTGDLQPLYYHYTTGAVVFERQAPVNVSLVIGDVAIGPQARLQNHIPLLRGIMYEPQQEWELLLQRLKSDFMWQEISYSQVQFVPSPHLDLMTLM